MDLLIPALDRQTTLCVATAQACAPHRDVLLLARQDTDDVERRLRRLS
jgi:hypothetical protein